MYIDDPSGVLGSKAAELQSLASPFDLKIAIVSTDSRAALDARVASMVTSSNTLAIGIDPTHHYTFTHFGVGTGVPRDRYQDIARSGNGEFKAGRWGDGVLAIASNAAAAKKESQHTTTTIVVPSQVTTVEKPVPIWPFALGAAAIALGFWLVWRWNKRRQAEISSTIDDFKSETAQMRSRNVEEQAWHDRFKEGRAAQNDPSPRAEDLQAQPPPPSPRTSRRVVSELPAPPPKAPPRRVVHHYVPAPIAPPPVVVQQSSGNDLLTGVLIGEAIASRPAYRAPEPEYHRHRTPTPDPSSFSSGSGGGGFDWGGSSDSGGSGGGDFGGGFDGGGGGGDF